MSCNCAENIHNGSRSIGLREAIERRCTQNENLKAVRRAVPFGKRLTPLGHSCLRAAGILLFKTLALVSVFTCCGSHTAQAAADGTWTNTNSGLWSTGTNWSGSVADGNGKTA